MPPDLQGILRVPKGKLDTPRDWELFLRRLNAQLKDDGERVVIDALATIASRTGTDIDTLVNYISDAGRATDQRFLPTVTYGNLSSVQDVVPLSAIAGSTNAAILVAAHTLTTDFGNIAYNSGAITGLLLNSRYYVYADDPDYEGGAVTYLASTNRQNVPANSGRYFVGTVETPAASANTNIIIGATSANPIVFETSGAHLWITGDEVLFDLLPGDFGTNLNATTHSIIVVDPTHFSIAVDGTTYAAYTSGGTATRVVPVMGGDVSGGGGGYLPAFLISLLAKAAWCLLAASTYAA